MKLSKNSLYGMFGGFPTISEMYNNKCFCCPADRQGNRCADVPGYMNENLSTLHKYNGKYGKGVVRTRPSFYKGRRSTNYMTIEYWVARDDIHKRLTGESEV